MTIIKALFLGLIASTACFAITISGKVTDTSGIPIAGASVLLKQNGQIATSGIDGSFLLGNVATKDHFSQSKLCRFSASITNNLLLVNLKEKSTVNVFTYNLQGREISSVRKVMNTGINSLLLPDLGSGVFLYKIKSDNFGVLLKNNSFGSYLQGQAMSEKGSGSYNSLAKQAKVTSAINDVIAVTKDGYLNYWCVMYNSDTSGIEIKMIVCADTVRDAEGNLYQAVRIGNQIWTVVNLRVTKYNDGTSIIKDTSALSWGNGTSGKYSFYNNSSDNDSIIKYGALYNSYAVRTGKLSPIGWHVPTVNDWQTLQTFLFNNGYNFDQTNSEGNFAITLAAKTDWNISSTIGTPGNNLSQNNVTGFTGIPSGYRTPSGTFSDRGNQSCWWRDPHGSTGNEFYLLTYNEYSFQGWAHEENYGFSVRLVK